MWHYLGNNCNPRAQMPGKCQTIDNEDLKILFLAMQYLKISSQYSKLEAKRNLRWRHVPGVHLHLLNVFDRLGPEFCWQTGSFTLFCAHRKALIVSVHHTYKHIAWIARTESSPISTGSLWEKLYALIFFLRSSIVAEKDPISVMVR